MAVLVLGRGGSEDPFAGLHLENRDDSILDVAVGVERDRSLEGRNARGLDVVADVRAGERLRVLDQALEGIGDDQDAVVGGQGIVLWVPVVLGRIFRDPVFRRGLIDRVGTGDRGIPVLGRRAGIFRQAVGVHA